MFIILWLSSLSFSLHRREKLLYENFQSTCMISCLPLSHFCILRINLWIFIGRWGDIGSIFKILENLTVPLCILLWSLIESLVTYLILLWCSWLCLMFSFGHRWLWRRTLIIYGWYIQWVLCNKNNFTSCIKSSTRSS